MKFQEKKEVESRIFDWIQAGDSMDAIKNKLIAQGYKEYEIKPLFFNPKDRLYKQELEHLKANRVEKLGHLDIEIKNDLFSIYARDKQNIQRIRIKELTLQNKSKEEIHKELASENIPTEMIDEVYAKTYAENENLDPGILEASISKAQLGLYASIAYTILKLIQIVLQVVKSQVSILTIITFIVGIAGCFYFSNSISGLKAKK